MRSINYRMAKKTYNDDGGESAYLDAMDREYQSQEEAYDNFYEWSETCWDRL